MPIALTSQSVLGVFSGPVQQLCLHWSVYVSHTDADGVLLEFVCVAETEQQGTDHLDLAGLPQRSANSDSTNTLTTNPEGKKKSKGIMKLFGKWVQNDVKISTS